MSTNLKLNQLTATIGAEVLNVDRDRLLNDDDVPVVVLAALERHSVLVFPKIGVDDQEQVKFGKRLGDLVARPDLPIPEITVITQDPDNPLADYLRGNTLWHIDGAMDDIPCKAGILTAHVVTSTDGGTEFANTRAAYDALTSEEKDEIAALRVVHTLEATLRPLFPNPTEEQLALWRKRPAKEHPLVWTQNSGRKSLVFGSTADRIVGWEETRGKQLLTELLERSTGPDRVLRHDWTVGDLVIWDNRGCLHRSTKYESTSPRELHRVTIAGDEAIR